MKLSMVLIVNDSSNQEDEGEFSPQTPDKSGRKSVKFAMDRSVRFEGCQDDE